MGRTGAQGKHIAEQHFHGMRVRSHQATGVLKFVMDLVDVLVHPFTFVAQSVAVVEQNFVDDHNEDDVNEHLPTAWQFSLRVSETNGCIGRHATQVRKREEDEHLTYTLHTCQTIRPTATTNAVRRW